MAQAKGVGNGDQYENMKEGIIGKYECYLYKGNDQNLWHFVEITPSPANDGSLIWKNFCVSWKLTPTKTPFKFTLSKDCPYFDTYKVMTFKIEQNMVLAAYGPHNEIYHKTRHFSSNLTNLLKQQQQQQKQKQKSSSSKENDHDNKEDCVTNGSNDRNDDDYESEGWDVAAYKKGVSLGKDNCKGMNSNFCFEGGKCKQGQCVGRVTIGDNFCIEFGMLIHGKTGNNWENIFHIGNENKERSPAMWLHPKSYKLHVRLSDSNNWNTGYDPNKMLEPDKDYKIKFSCVNGKVELFINGELKQSCDDVVHIARYRAPVWIGDPWHDAANVTIKDFKVYCPQ